MKIFQKCSVARCRVEKRKSSATDLGWYWWLYWPHWGVDRVCSSAYELIQVLCMVVEGRSTLCHGVLSGSVQPKFVVSRWSSSSEPDGEACNGMENQWGSENSTSKDVHLNQNLMLNDVASCRANHYCVLIYFSSLLIMAKFCAMNHTTRQFCCVVQWLCWSFHRREVIVKFKSIWF